MKYSQIRDSIKNGDIAFFSGGHPSFIRRVIAWFSKGEIYHTGIAFWMIEGQHKRLMLAESQPDGFRIINLSAYQDREIAIIRTGIDWRLISEETIGSAGMVKYDFVDLVAIGLHERFGVPLPKITGAGMVCSVIVAEILKGAGVKISSVMISPQRLFNELSAEFGILTKE